MKEQMNKTDDRGSLGRQRVSPLSGRGGAKTMDGRNWICFFFIS